MPPPPALPTFFELDAPDDWTAIDFISDLHLSGESPRTFEVWADYMRGTPASAASTLDGFPLARQGLAGRAMGIWRPAVRIAAPTTSSPCDSRGVVGEGGLHHAVVAGAGVAVVVEVEMVVVDHQPVEEPDPLAAVVVELLADQDLVE